MMSPLPNLPTMLSCFMTSLSNIVDYIFSSKLVQLAIGLNALAICIFLVFTDRPQTEHDPWKGHKRGGSSVYPPGMQFDVVQKKWARRGMDSPFPHGIPPEKGN